MSVEKTDEQYNFPLPKSRVIRTNMGHGEGPGEGFGYNYMIVPPKADRISILAKKENELQ